MHKSTPTLYLLPSMLATYESGGCDYSTLDCIPSNDHVEECVDEHESHRPGNAEGVDGGGGLHCTADLKTDFILLEPKQQLHSKTHARVGEDT